MTDAVGDALSGIPDVVGQAFGGGEAAASKQLDALQATVQKSGTRTSVQIKRKQGSAFVNVVTTP